jgi:hypothetical protein
MNERAFRFTIHYRLPRRQETPAVIGAKLLDSLDALSRIDPLFANWKVLDSLAMASLPLAIARTRISTIVENNIVRDDYDQPEPESGYSLVSLTGNAIPSRIVIFSLGVGAVFDGEMSLRFGDVLQPTDPLIVTYRLFRETLLATSALATALGLCLSFHERLLEGTDRAGRARHSSQSLPHYLDRLSVARGRPRLRH